MKAREHQIIRRQFVASTIPAVGALLCHNHPLAAGEQSTSLDPLSWGEIWDVHGHLAGAPGATPEKRIAHILKAMEQMRISRLCIFMGMNFSYDPSPQEMRQQNDEVLQALQAAGNRVLGFVYLNPKHLQASLDEIERCIVDGPMVGIKLWVAVKANHENLDAILQRASELNAIIYQHTWIKVAGNLSGESTPMDLAELAARHPDTSLICGHAGGDWELGIRAVRAYKNVSVELGGGFPTAGFTEMAVRELGVQRVIFGSDVPGRSFATQLAKVIGANLPEAWKSQILAGNLKQLLHPIMKKKGLEL